MQVRQIGLVVLSVIVAGCGSSAPLGGSGGGSGTTGKAIGSFYYLAQYQREQSQTKVE